MLVVALGALVSSAAEPLPEPVRWRTSVKATGSDTGIVTFRAIVAPGWHLYGLDIPQGGPVATSVDLAKSTGMVFTGPLTPSRKADEIFDPMFDMKLSWWDSDVEFTVAFKLDGKADPVLSATIRFMTCDGNSCRPPKTETVTTPVKLTRK